MNERENSIQMSAFETWTKNYQHYDQKKSFEMISIQNIEKILRIVYFNEWTGILKITTYFIKYMSQSIRYGKLTIRLKYFLYPLTNYRKKNVQINWSYKGGYPFLKRHHIWIWYRLKL